MRRVQHKNNSQVIQIFPTVSKVRRNIGNFRGLLLDDAGTIVAESKCISCVTTPCMKQDLGNRIVESCPVQAIAINPNTGKIQISEDCISCGLCALRCPVGAIEWTADKPALVHSDHDISNMSVVKPDIQMDWLSNLRHSQTASLDSIQEVARIITDNLKREKASVIYPLVASYLQVLGFSATASNMGDTSSRADVTIKTAQGTVPIEVKSYTEVEFINLKSVQQAFENKLLTARQDQVSKLNTLSSLAIAFSYPSDRSRLDQLIEDVDGAFGIRIGIISLPRLLETVIGVSCGKLDFDKNSILGLKGLF